MGSDYCNIYGNIKYKFHSEVKSLRYMQRDFNLDGHIEDHVLAWRERVYYMHP